MEKSPKWKEKLMDEFCLMFERADRADTGEGEEVWVKRLESFISQEIEAAEKEGYNRGYKDGKNSLLCIHKWVKCSRQICTSDLHSHHCSKCNKHSFWPDKN